MHLGMVCYWPIAPQLSVLYLFSIFPVIILTTPSEDCSTSYQLDHCTLWEALPGADWDWYRYLKPTTGLKSGTPMEGLEAALKELKGMTTPKED